MREGGYQKIAGLLEFVERFPDEEACRSFLFSRRWPEGFSCPRCGHHEHSFIATRHLYRCKRCRYQCSLTAGTVMEKTKTPIRIWFWLIYLMASQRTGFSILSFSRMAGIHYQTAWTCAHKIRAAMRKRDARYLLCGLVELDDSYFGTKRSGKRGRGAEGRRPVLVGADIGGKGPAHAAMRVLPDVSASSIEEEAVRCIREGSQVLTDGFASYPAALSSYEHQGITLGSLKEAGSRLPWVHVLLANVKGMLRGVHHGVSRKHLQPYLSEFCWRFSRRFFEAELFDRLLRACICARPPTYRELAA